MEKRVANVSNAYMHTRWHLYAQVLTHTSHTKNYFVRVCWARIHTLVQKEEKNTSMGYEHTVGKYMIIMPTAGWLPRTYTTHTHNGGIALYTPIILCVWVVVGLFERSAIWMGKRAIRMVSVAHKITSFSTNEEKKDYQAYNGCHLYLPFWKGRRK